MSTKVTTAQSTPTGIKQLSIASNKVENGSVSLVNGTLSVMYYESILQDSVMSVVTFADTGNSVPDPKDKKKRKSVMEGLPLVGQEKALLEIVDGNDVSLKLDLYVNNPNSVAERTTKNLSTIQLVSREFERNEESRVNIKFEGKISDHITKILTDKRFLDTDKNLDIEETSNSFSYNAMNKKPFYVLNVLSGRCVPNGQGSLGNTAGFFFFETSEGFKFKSIDSLLGQDLKKRIIYNETPDSRGANIPEGYDIKALTYVNNNRMNVQKKLMLGYQSTKIETFNPYTLQYSVSTLNSEDFVDAYQLGGKELFKLNPEFESEGSRKTFVIQSVGVNPTGTTDQQLKKSKDEDFEFTKILNQSIMRYNQLFSSKVEITIPGDFSLHAGDVIQFDAPSPQSDTKNDEVDRKNGGLYIISSLCHFVSIKGTYTKIDLVRDSIGRKVSSSDISKPKPATPTKIPGIKPSSEIKPDTRRSTTTTF